MNVKINAKNMKYRLLFVVVYSIPFFSVEAQGVSSKGTLGYTFEEKKRDARASGDSFLQRGDTLYLLYDLTDSLQIKTGEGVEWWQRFLTEEEIAIIEDPSHEDMFDLGEPDMFLVRRWRLSPRKELSSEEIGELTLTTRDEVIAFYEREVKRLTERKAKDKRFKIYVRVWGFFNLEWYFDKIYMIIPKTGSSAIMYDVCAL